MHDLLWSEPCLYIQHQFLSLPFSFFSLQGYKDMPDSTAVLKFSFPWPAFPNTPLPTHPSKSVYICSPPWIFHSSPVRVGHSALCPRSTPCLPFFQHLPLFPGWFLCLLPHIDFCELCGKGIVSFFFSEYTAPNIMTSTYWSYNKYFNKCILFSIEDSYNLREVTMCKNMNKLNKM